MSLNPYAPCPCGSGKKLKFCCADLAGDIEKIHRMIEGDQHHAALRHVEQSLARAPDRASLLNLKAMIELMLGDLESATATVDAFLKAHPNNAIALASQAVILAHSKGGAAAVMPLQKALAASADNVPRRVIDAIGAAGQALLMSGHIMAGQAHLWLYQALRPDDSRALELLIGLYQSSGLPVLLRSPLRLKEWTADAPWRDEAGRATDLADHGRWYEATLIIDRLGQEYGPDPSLLYNRAVLGGRLGDDRALVAGFHAYAQLDVPRDDAIEAEAIAQLLDRAVSDPPVDTVKLTFNIADLEQLQSRLDEAPQLDPYEGDMGSFVQPGGPRPRRMYLLLDRSPPPGDNNLTRDQIPQVLGFVAVFGRQTDRPERLEFVTDRHAQFQENVDRLREVAGEALSEQSGEEVVGHLTEAELALSWRWQFPVTTPYEVRRRLLAEERRSAIVDRWPDVPRAVLAGKTPRQAAGDPELAIPLAALVLILETGANNIGHADALEELREALGLQQSERLRLEEHQWNGLPLTRARRVDFSTASDEALTGFYRRAVFANVTDAIRHAAQEALQRPSIAEQIPPRDAYERLIQAEPDPATAMEWIEEARSKFAALGESTAPWDLMELELHLLDANVTEVQRCLRQISDRHGDDPEVVADVYRMLYEAGLITPDDLTGQQPIFESIDSLPAEEPAVQEGRIWTPGDELASVPGQKKSRIWTPS